MDLNDYFFYLLVVEILDNWVSVVIWLVLELLVFNCLGGYKYD